MRTYLSDIIPRIQRYSKKLDNLILLTNQHWVILDDIDKSKKVFIFRNNGELLISINGRVNKGKWEFLGNNTLLIDQNNNSYLYKHGFFDESILALKMDGVNEYLFIVNETKFDGELNSLENITTFLEEKYLKSEKFGNLYTEEISEIEDVSKKIINYKYKIIGETNGWSFSTGKYKVYKIEFGNESGTVLFDSKKGEYFYSTFDKIRYFSDLNDCILSYIEYIETKE